MEMIVKFKYNRHTVFQHMDQVHCLFFQWYQWLVIFLAVQQVYFTFCVSSTNIWGLVINHMPGSLGYEYQNEFYNKKDH